MENDDKIAAILTELKDFRKETNGRLDKMDEKIDTSIERLDKKIDDSIERLDKKIDDSIERLDKKIDDNQRRNVKGVTDMFERMDKSISKQFQEIKDILNKSIEENEIEHKLFRKKFADLDEETQENADRIENIEDWIEEYEENNGVAV